MSRLHALLRKDIPAQITVANLVALVLALATVPVIARGLGPEGRGVTAAAIASFVLVPVLIGVGLPLEVRRRCSQGIDAAAVRSARDLVLLLFVPAAAVATIMDFTLYRAQGAGVRGTIFIGVTLAPVALSWAVDTAALVGAGRYRAVFVLRVLQPAATLAALPLLWGFNLFTPVWILVAFIGANALTAVAGWSLVKVSLRGSRASRSALVRSGVTFAGSAIAEAATARVDQILILPLVGASQAGLYSVALSISSLPLALGHALGASSFRIMAQALKDEKPAEKVASVELKNAISLTLVGVLALGLSSVWLLPVIFGEDFRAGVPVLLVLLPGSLCMTTAYVASMLLAAQGRGRVMTLTQVVGLCVNLALLYLLAGQYEAVGAALASSLAYAVLLAMQVRALGSTPWAVLPTWRATVRSAKSLLR